VVTQELPLSLGERYTILTRIGVGGMGTVYLARDTRHDRRVAVKVLKPDLATTLGPQRFLREIQIAASLTHPNIVPLYDSGEVDGHLFYVMPYIEGESLRQRLRRETMLPVPQVLEWAAEVGEGLAFLHSHGIVHRDIKPENLLIQGEHLLIADFGIARAIDQVTGNGLTSQQFIVGTPHYMSPEQASGLPNLDGRTDVYSLGCVVYEMLAGEPPFVGPNTQAITAKKMSGQYSRIRVVRPTVPGALDRAIQRALAPIPADRFRTADEFCGSLRGAGRIRWRPLPWIAALTAVSVTAGLAWQYGLRSGHSSERHQRVVVGMFDNRTGDPRNDPLGFMAADWVIEGLQRTGSVEVVPTLTALAATKFLRRVADTVDPVRGLARETGANLVVNGSIYRNQDSLVFQAQLVDATAGKLVGAVEPVRVAETQSGNALQLVRTRLMGMLALSMDERVLYNERPPSYTAYQAFSHGMDAYLENDYTPALAAFIRAYSADSSFVLPLLYASFCYTNSREWRQADSVLHLVAKQRDRLNAYDQHWLDYQMAELAGRDDEALAAIRKAAELAPTSKATYNFAIRAIEARQPVAAESALRRLSPDVGPMRGWLPYWDGLAIALHAQEKYQEELTAARAAQRRFRDRPAAYLSEARALAARGRVTELEKMWLNVTERMGPTALESGALAMEAGSELWAHGDSTASRAWFSRSYDAFASADTSTSAIDARWGRARAAARLGRLREALQLGEALAGSSPQPEYLGFLAVVSAQLGSRDRAAALLRQLETDSTPYMYGRPQLQAGRVAAVLGDVDRAAKLLTSAYRRGYPFELETHRDNILLPLRNLPILRKMDARSK
jgi:TolB-like protein